MELNLEIDSRPVVLAGNNGAGKTNILEAISLLAPGRGLRRAQLADLINRPAVFAEVGMEEHAPDINIERENLNNGYISGNCAISTILQQDDDAIRLGTAIEKTPSHGLRRVARIDRKNVALNDLASYVSLIWLTPQLDRLFMEGPGNRRRFLDRLTLAHDPGHVSRVSAYERAVRERQKLLNDYGSDRAWIETLEQQMAEYGIAITAARLEIVEGLSTECLTHAIDRFPTPQLHLEGGVEKILKENSALQAEEDYVRHLRNNRGLDQHSGRTKFGPHTSDLTVINAQKSMAASDCSTGEQKALLISIVLASARMAHARNPRQSPLVLLDEIIAHLDVQRREILFDSISDLNCQVWMTGTDLNLFEAFGERAQAFAVDNGALCPG